MRTACSIILLLATGLATSAQADLKLEPHAGALEMINGSSPIHAALTTRLTPARLSPISDQDEALTALAKEILQCGVNIRGPLCEGSRFLALDGQWIGVVPLSDQKSLYVKALREISSARTFLMVYDEGAGQPGAGYLYAAPDATAGLSRAYGLLSPEGLKSRPLLTFPIGAPPAESEVGAGGPDCHSYFYSQDGSIDLVSSGRVAVIDVLHPARVLEELVGVKPLDGKLQGDRETKYVSVVMASLYCAFGSCFIQAVPEVTPLSISSIQFPIPKSLNSGVFRDLGLDPTQGVMTNFSRAHGGDGAILCSNVKKPDASCLAFLSLEGPLPDIRSMVQEYKRDVEAPAMGQSLRCYNRTDR